MAEDDAYWQESQTTQEAKAFNFEDDEAESQLCGVSQSGTARLSQQVRAGIATTFDESPAAAKQLLGYGIPKEPNIPISALLSETAINKIVSSNACDVSTEPSERPPIHTVLTKLLLGHPVSLEPFRSLNDKTQLLDAALEIGDGNAVLKVVMFLESTLKKSIWQRLLLERPEALNQYASYLETRFRHQELSDLLEMVGKSREASKKQILFSLNPGNPQRQAVRLRQCLKNHLANDDDRDHVEQWCTLLEWQLSLAFSSSTIAESLPGSSVVETVALGCRYHRAGIEPSRTDPIHIAQRFNLSAMQTEWTLVEEWAQAQAWEEIEALLFKKSWLGRRKLQTYHTPAKLVNLLHKYKAPSSVIDIYLQQIDSLEERGTLARRLGCHMSLIDVLAAQKDRLALISLQASLEPTEEAHHYAEKTLNTPNMKWKN